MGINERKKAQFASAGMYLHAIGPTLMYPKLWGKGLVPEPEVKIVG
jgi:hypothetical protein